MATRSDTTVDFKSSAEVRTHLVRAMKSDLIGPFAEEGAEVLEVPPSRWYLTGFLVPEQGRQSEEDPTQQEDLGAGNDESDEESSPQEPSTKRRGRLPA